MRQMPAQMQLQRLQPQGQSGEYCYGASRRLFAIILALVCYLISMQEAMCPHYSNNMKIPPASACHKYLSEC